MGATRVSAAAILLVAQGCVIYVTPSSYNPPQAPAQRPSEQPRGSIRPAAAQIAAPGLSRKHVTLISTPPVLAAKPDSKQATIGAGGFNAVSFFTLDFKIGSTTNQPFRISVAASGGYRNDFVSGWFATVPAAGAQCVAFRADVLGIEVLRQGLELPTALPGMGENATSRVPTTIDPGSEIPVHVLFGCGAPIQVGQLLNGRIRLLIGQNGTWSPEDLLIPEQPLISK